MSIVRRNVEIQLEILFRFFNAHINNQKYTETDLVRDLRGTYSFEELSPHLVYLIDGGFIIGENTTTRAGTIPFTSRISYKGINTVQSIIDQTIPELDKISPTDLQNADTNKKFSILREIWENRKEIYGPVIQFLIDRLQEFLH